MLDSGTRRSRNRSASERPSLTDNVIILDAHTTADVAAHMAGEDEEQSRRFGWYPARSTEDGVRAAIERWQEQWATDGDTRAFALREHATRLLAGGCEVRRRESGRAEVSYWIFPQFRGRGYASRGVRLLSEWTFTHLSIVRLEAYIEPDNAASRGVVRRAGFIEEGVLREHAQSADGRRDMVLYSLLPSDPARLQDS